MDSQIEKQLEKIMPVELVRTLESAFYVSQGKGEHLEDLFQNGGVLLRTVANRFSSTQIILGIAAVAAVAAVIVSRVVNDEEDGVALAHGDSKRNESQRQIGS